MKLGIIGTGMIVKTALPCLANMPEYTLQAIASTEKSKDVAQQLSEQYNIKEVYTDYLSLLNDKEVETVYVATPNNLHYIMCQNALLKGKNVICEKPFTSNYNQLVELMKLAEEKQLFLLEAIAPTFYPNVKELKNLLPLIGRIKIVDANYSKYSSRYTAFKQGKIMPAFDVACCGGALMDLNIYNLHMLALLFGESTKIQYHANIEKGIDTSGIVTVDYPDFKAVLIGSKDCNGNNCFCIQAEQGMINITPSIDGTKDIKVIMQDEVKEYPAEKDVHYMYYEFKEFERIIREKDYASANKLAQTSLIVMRMVTEARIKGNIIFADDKA